MKDVKHLGKGNSERDWKAIIDCTIFALLMLYLTIASSSRAIWAQLLEWFPL